ncbi:hypothetical protein HMPREF9372_3819 [Sporosarcina newyorkensis 2681]|uniref:Uncharacterized protein n=1 Tax=Sporosarcina newyorkensis 2681 TaxID=1027292 RepID=F9DYD8_9BACL|nr:hypothetical protein HMPREF9372_3819 [Sporosarcina newyorkensis 2681]
MKKDYNTDEHLTGARIAFNLALFLLISLTDLVGNFSKTFFLKINGLF